MCEQLGVNNLKFVSCVIQLQSIIKFDFKLFVDFLHLRPSTSTSWSIVAAVVQRLGGNETRHIQHHGGDTGHIFEHFLREGFNEFSEREAQHVHNQRPTRSRMIRAYIKMIVPFWFLIPFWYHCISPFVKWRDAEMPNAQLQLQRHTSFRPIPNLLTVIHSHPVGAATFSSSSWYTSTFVLFALRSS